MGIPESLEKAFEGADTIDALTELFMEGGMSYKEAQIKAIEKYKEAQNDRRQT